MQKGRKKQAKNPFGLMKKKKKKEEEEEDEDEKQELEFAEGFRRINNITKITFGHVISKFKIFTATEIMQADIYKVHTTLLRT